MPTRPRPAPSPRRVAIVTGAGSAAGIGFAAASLLGRRGLQVVITSTTTRIHDRVAELAAQGIEAAGAGRGPGRSRVGARRWSTWPWSASAGSTCWSTTPAWGGSVRRRW